MSYNFTGSRWEDIPVVVRTTGTYAPDYAVFQPDGTGGLRLYEFRSDAVREVFFELQIPRGVVQGSKVKPHVHFVTANTRNYDKVRWNLEYTIRDVDSATAYDAPTTITGDYTFGDNMAYKHLTQAIDSAAINLSKTTSGAVLVGRLWRAGGTSPDTFAGHVQLLGLHFSFQRDNNGSLTD